MEWMSIIALFLLTMMGYSFGSVLGSGRDRSISPELIDLGMFIALSFIALIARSWLGIWTTVIVGFLAALVLSGLKSRASRKVDGFSTKDLTAPIEGRGWKKIWEAWKALAAEAGNFQGRMLLAVFYFVVITPWGIFVRLTGDPLGTKAQEASGLWIDRQPSEINIEEAKKQF